MKKVQGLILIICFAVFSAYSQETKSFEGIIEYDIDYIVKDSTARIWETGNAATVYIKDGYYKQEYHNSKNVEKVIYHPDSNIYYTFFHDTSYVHRWDMSRITDTIRSIYQNDSITNILGHLCKHMVFNYDDVKTMYYYTEDFYIDPKYFKNHLGFSYCTYTQKTKSVYLKLVISYDKYDFVMTARSIKPKSVNIEEFEI